jgi:hypothetical protein
MDADLFFGYLNCFQKSEITSEDSNQKAAQDRLLFPHRFNNHENIHFSLLPPLIPEHSTIADSFPILRRRMGRKAA